MQGGATTQQGDRASEPTQKYRVLFKLSEGGTANVFLGVAQGPVGFNKLVVLKMPKEYVFHEAESRRMFMNEARLAARLNHANIVQTNEVIEHAGRLVIVMEYLEGQPLSSILARGRTSIPLAMHLAILSEALNGLHYAHEHTDFDGTPLNLVHRDMTPQNVFVTYDGHVKLLDFGIAKLDRTDGGTQPGVFKGKVRYMSAQQMMGQRLDRRADLYAVGVMLWEAATQDRMWRNVPQTTLMRRVTKGDIPPPSSVSPAVSPELERICMKALAYAAADRYATATELQADIDALRATLGQHTMSREIGRFVSELFATERASAKRSLEAQLSQGASLSWDEYWTTESDVSAMLKPRDALTSQSEEATRILDREPPARSSAWSRGWLLLGLLAVIVGTAAALLLAWRGAPREAPRQAAVPLAPVPPVPTAAPPATPALVTVTFSASPAEARIYLDDAGLAANPFSATMPRDGAPHQVRAEAPGYLTSKADVVLDKDATVVLSLEKEPQPREVGRGEVGRGVPKASQPSASAPPVVAPVGNCDPPFSIDARGIKKFKPECL